MLARVNCGLNYLLRFVLWQ